MNAEGGRGGLLLSGGGDALNNVDIFDNNGVIIRIKTSGEIKEYIMQLKSYGNKVVPAISLEYLREGQKISMPTVREYDNRKTRGCNIRYRILNKVDYLYIHEIKEID